MHTGHTSPGPIGLDISSQHIAAVQLSATGTLLAATRFKRHASDTTMTVDEVRRMSDVLERTGFVGNQVVVGIPDELLLWAPASLPPQTSNAPIEALAHAELARNASLDFDALESQCWIVPASARFGDRTQVIATGCSHQIANAFLDPLDNAGLETIALEPRPCAAAAACHPIASAEDGIVALIEIGDASSSPHLLLKGTPIYSRSTVDIGLNTLIQDIEQHLGFSRDACQLLIEQISDPLVMDMDFGTATADIARHISSYLDSLSRELRTAIDYATYCYPDLTTHRVILFGEGARLPGVQDQVGQQIGLPPMIATPARLIHCDDVDADLIDDPALVVALGLAQFGEER